jgi:hypothetical protein
MNPELLEISKNLRTQDNRITNDPMFCVQVRERVYGFDSDHADHMCEVDADGNEIEDASKDAADYEHDESGITTTGYRDFWKTVMVCFTEAGCQEHLRQNQHNYGHYEETRIYVESFYRNPEMIAIRNYLMKEAL